MLKPLLATFLLTLLVSAVAWFEVIEDRVMPKRFGIVEPGRIYRSGQIHGDLIQPVLEENDIGLVIDLQFPENLPDPLAETRVLRELGIDQARFPLNGDGTGNPEHYVQALVMLDNAVNEGVPVLVHCAAGSQRTSGMLAIYRTLVQGWPVEAVVDEMAMFDWDPVDDQVLLAYLDEHLPFIVARLVDEGVIDAAPAELPRFMPAMAIQ